jgi:hypothetical protein
MQLLWPKLTAKITVRDGTVQLNTETTCWLGFWMDGHMIFQVDHNRCMKKASAAEARP